eukprot:COSAG06_NODE_243_length_19221_cov_15.057578_10_plen_196_part_00
MDVPEKSSAVLTWDRDQVSSFLASLRWTEGDASLAAAVASASRQAGVDGAALLELGPDAWKELGVESAVRQAQYVAAVRKLTTTRNDAVAHAARALRESQYPETDDDKPTSEFKLWAWVYPWLTSDGGGYTTELHLISPDAIVVVRSRHHDLVGAAQEGVEHWTAEGRNPAPRSPARSTATGLRCVMSGHQATTA